MRKIVFVDLKGNKIIFPKIKSNESHEDNDTIKPKVYPPVESSKIPKRESLSSSDDDSLSYDDSSESNEPKVFPSMKKGGYFKFYDEDVTSVVQLTSKQYKKFIELALKYPKMIVEIDHNSFDDLIHCELKNLEVVPITKSQYDVIDNTKGIDLYEEFMDEFEKIENHGGDISFRFRPGFKL